MNAWLKKWFNAKERHEGAVIRRKIASVRKQCGGSDDQLIAAVAELGWTLLTVGDQFVVVCSKADPTVVVGKGKKTS